MADFLQRKEGSPVRAKKIYIKKKIGYEQQEALSYETFKHLWWKWNTPLNTAVVQQDAARYNPGTFQRRVLESAT